jgi:hypothetical protein
MKQGSYGDKYGAFQIAEHSVKIGGQWGNFFTCSKNLVFSPFSRLNYFLVTGAWNKIGGHLDNVTDYREMDKFYMNNLVAADSIQELLSSEEGVWERVEQICETELGSGWGGCLVCSKEGSRASNKDFRTVVDLREYAGKDRTYKNQIKIFASSGDVSKVLSACQKDCNPGKRFGKGREGLGLYQYKVLRPQGDKIQGCGTSFTLEDEVEFDYLKELSPDAVFTFTEDNVRDLVNEDNSFRYHTYRSGFGTDISKDDVINHICETFGVNTEKSVDVPWVADYFKLLLPMTPNKLRETFGADNDEDIPF